METLGNLRRTRYCGEVTLADAGQEMTVCGSIARARDKGGIIFADLRDTTGHVELYVSELRVLSEAQTPPFEIRDGINVGDDLRLRYRYLDLRRPSMHEPIVLRSKIMQIIRSYFCDNHFTEIETPTLIKLSLIHI